ncbi:HAD hydrolase-like protein [Stecheria sp. CLA-KB-P133]|uniref:HAD hydrolase-like protein n=1 Tax=Grylomicrobium aquisgranensis TaxID=2926318 RepID=A0AB35U307_9FIRM|nr:HAD hydrolase-like protein [Stecheria sp. CLA-KB-P133]
MLRKCHLIAGTALEKNHQAAPGAIALIDALLRTKTPFLIVSEESQHPRIEMVEHYRGLGFASFSPDVIFTSTMAAIDWVAREYPNRISAAYLGGRGMKASLQEAGFDLLSKQPQWLFLGYDPNAASPDYNEALRLLKQGTVLLNTDSSPVHEGIRKTMVGCGAVARMLEYASGKKCLDFGRPSVITMASALKYAGCEPKDAVYMGDDFQKDIVPAIRLKMDTAYVTLGSSIYDSGINDSVHPKWIVEDLSGLAH